MGVDILIVGTGEYVTGYVHGQQVNSDKKIGVAALVYFDLKRRNKEIGRIVLAGTNGTKFPGIRKHFDQNIAKVYRDLDISFESFPADDISSDPNAYLKALARMKKGDIAVIYTPDDTHFEIALACLQHGLHVLLTKPAVKTLEHHKKLKEVAKSNNLLLAIEFHKRFDPIYLDAHDRIPSLGEFSFFYFIYESA